MIKINAELRTEDFGSAGSRRLVRAGKLPAEMYGKEGNFHIILDAHDFDLTLRKLAHLQGPSGKHHVWQTCPC